MKRNVWTGILGALGMLVLILDTKTALSGAQEGLQLCFGAVVPSLFPFCVLSILITGSLAGVRSRLLRPLERLLKLPEGTGSLYVIGLLGGYPTGAQGVALCQEKGQLTQAQAGRMLGFCSNAGPAFIFGICGGLFPKGWMVWLLWLIHIISSVAVGMLLPRVRGDAARVSEDSVSFPQAVQRAIRSMAGVCGWVVLFRMAIAFLDRWFLLLIPSGWRVFFLGLLELTNGCCLLKGISSVSLRFFLSSVFLAFGGLCVAMQTTSCTKQLGMYLPGKLLQAVFSAALSSLFTGFWGGDNLPAGITVLSFFLAVAAVFVQKLPKRKNKSSIPAAVGV